MTYGPRTTTKHGPAAGTTKGKAPYPAGLETPEFLRLDALELHKLLAILRDPLLTQVYMLIVVNGDFITGEFLGSYARLMELCTPPQPERGLRRPQPTYKQIRRCVDDLIDHGLVTRNSEANESQGQLRLKTTPRKKEVTSS